MIQNLLNTVADQSLRSLAAFPGNRQAKAQPGSEAAGLWFAEKAWLFSRKKQSLIGRSSKLQVTRFCTKVIPARGTGGRSRREVQAAAQAADGSEKSEKRVNLTDFKRPLWETMESNPVFADQHAHKPYEASAPFYYDGHTPRVPQLAANTYEISPLLLKDAALPMKHDSSRSLMHSSSVPLPWDKSTAALLGSMCKSPPQKQRVMNSKSLPADLDEVRKFSNFQ